MKSTPEISIIIPLFNAERFLRECLRSVLSQSWTDYELILVDDGSTDNSLQICDEFCTQDRRIQILRSEHAGVSVARNTGIAASSGQYLFFMDADDTLLPDALAVLHQTAVRKNADWVRGEYIAVDQSGDFLFESPEAAHRKQWHDKILSGREFAMNVLCGEYFLWTSLFHRGLLEKQERWFTPGLAYCEDLEFLLRYMADSRGAVCLNQVVYAYRKSPSAVSSRLKPEHLHGFRMIDAEIEIMTKQESDPKFCVFLNEIRGNLFGLSLKGIAGYSNRDFRDQLSNEVGMPEYAERLAHVKDLSNGKKIQLYRLFRNRTIDCLHYYGNIRGILSKLKSRICRYKSRRNNILFGEKQ